MPVRLSKADAARLLKNEPLEADIQRTCSDFLFAEGWRMIRTDPVSDVSVVRQFTKWIFAQPALSGIRELVLRGLSQCQRGKGFGEVGMADCLYIRYSYLGPADSDRLRCVSQVLWIEWKRMKNGRATEATPAQKQWHADERRRGATTLVAGVDFPASVEGFIGWYRESGLWRLGVPR